MRPTLLVLMLLPPIVSTVAMLLLHLQLRNFQRAVPKIHGAPEMQRFKYLATFQMRVANLLLPVMPLPMLIEVIVIWLYGRFIAHVLGWGDLVLFGFLPLTLPFIVSGLTIGTARQVRATPASDSSLEAERDHVAHVWVHENRPDW